MKKINYDRPRPEYLMIGENAPKKRCKIHIWRRKSNPKVCRNCGRMKPQDTTIKDGDIIGYIGGVPVIANRGWAEKRPSERSPCGN